MATPGISGAAHDQNPRWALKQVTAFPRMRALAWDGTLLYASQAYSLLCADMAAARPEWKIVGYFRPPWWRNLSATVPLSYRLFRDGFHALAVLPSGHFVAAVPGTIISLAPGDTEFRVSHKIERGTRPLHITATPGKRLYWGEYFDNPQRVAVHIYCSEDRGWTWEVAYTFPEGTIRHVHNLVYDEWDDCLWILTGDSGNECRILRVSCDFKTVDVVLSGNQQARAVALVPTRDALYLATDTPLERNHVYSMDRKGGLTQLAELASSSIYGCRVDDAVFFSTMVEPSAVNLERNACIYGSQNGSAWTRLLAWKKDAWPMSFFQYGNAQLPDGNNTSGLLAVTTVAVESADLEMSLWRV
jgi:hypothetical protein